MAELGKKWSEKGTTTGLQGNMKMLFLNPAAANAKDRNVLGSLDQVKNYLFLSIPPAPSGVAWVTKPTVTVLENGTVEISEGEASFEGVSVFYLLNQIPVPLPEDGFIRQDAIAALSDGSYTYRFGTAGPSAVTPPIPSNALFVAYVLFTSEGGVVENPGINVEASIGLPATTVLKFENPLGESHLPLVQSGPITFTLGAGTQRAMVVKRMLVTSDGVSPITFGPEFTYQYLGLSEDETLPVSDTPYEFTFAYNEEGTVSVSVPGSAPGTGVLDIASLPALPSAITNTDLFAVSRGGVVYKATGAQLKTFVGAVSPDPQNEAPSAPQNILISNITADGYTATADPSTDS